MVLPKYLKEWLALQEGGEEWTNVFGDRFDERVCVGFAGGEYFWHDGEKFKATQKEIKALYDEYYRSGEGYWLMKEASA